MDFLIENIVRQINFLKGNFLARCRAADEGEGATADNRQTYFCWIIYKGELKIKIH